MVFRLNSTKCRNQNQKDIWGKKAKYFKGKKNTSKNSMIKEEILRKHWILVKY